MTRSRYQPTDVTFNQVAELFLAELRNGNAPSVEVFAQTFPHIADELRESLPSIAVAESFLAPKSTKQQVLTSLDGFELKRELGQGAMGVVYEAVDKALGRNVAIKVIPLSGKNGSTAVVDRFELERQAMARLEHPNIVPVYSYGHNESHAYLVMKLVQGYSLHDLQAGRGDFRLKYIFNELKDNWEQLAKLGADVAAGLQHAHEQGLVHRDIKPGNLLLDQEGKIWVTDFGLAKLTDYSRSLSMTGDIIGTPRYMAPEQLRGICDARGDIYSLGVTLYELAGKCKVWDDKSELSLITQRSSAVLPNLNDLQATVPAELAKIIMKACELSPDDRYQTAAELHVVLSRFANGCRLGDRRRGKRLADAIYFKQARRRRITIAVLSTCAAASLGFICLRGTPEQPSTVSPTPPIEATPVVLRDSAVGLIDKLADEKDADMVEIVSDFLEKSLVESSEDLNFSPAAQQELKEQVNVITQKIKTDGLDKEDLERFLDGYRKTSLPTATRIMRLTVLVQKSSFTNEEKAAATDTLRRLAAYVAHNAVSEDEAIRLIYSLTKSQANTTEELLALNIPDEGLRSWFADLYTKLSKLPPIKADSTANYKNLRGVFQDAFGER